MEDEKILIDRKTLKAISSDTRMDLLKYLSSRKYTLSELSKKMDLKGPTIKEHLDNLIDSNLVKKEETENKWKYYSLTDKGKKLVKPKEIKILISFVVSLFSTLGLIGYYIFNFLLGKKSMDFYTERSVGVMDSSVQIASDSIVGQAEPMVGQAQAMVVESAPAIIETSYLNKEIIIFIAILFFISLTVFLLFLVIKEKKRYNKCVKVID